MEAWNGRLNASKLLQHSSKVCETVACDVKYRWFVGNLRQLNKVTSLTWSFKNTNTYLCFKVTLKKD